MILLNGCHFFFTFYVLETSQSNYSIYEQTYDNKIIKHWVSVIKIKDYSSEVDFLNTNEGLYLDLLISCFKPLGEMLKKCISFDSVYNFDVDNFILYLEKIKFMENKSDINLNHFNFFIDCFQQFLKKFVKKDSSKILLLLIYHNLINLLLNKDINNIEDLNQNLTLLNETKNKISDALYGIFHKKINEEDKKRFMDEINDKMIKFKNFVLLNVNFSKDPETFDLNNVENSLNMLITQLNSEITNILNDKKYIYHLKIAVESYINYRSFFLILMKI